MPPPVSWISPERVAWLNANYASHESAIAPALNAIPGPAPATSNAIRVWCKRHGLRRESETLKRVLRFNIASYDVDPWPEERAAILVAHWGLLAMPAMLDALQGEGWPQVSAKAVLQKARRLGLYAVAKMKVERPVKEKKPRVRKAAKPKPAPKPKQYAPSKPPKRQPVRVEVTDADIAAWIARNGITRCPAAMCAPTTGSNSPSDQDALRRYHEQQAAMAGTMQERIKAQAKRNVAAWRRAAA